MKLSLTSISLGLAAALVAMPVDSLLSSAFTHRDSTVAVAQVQQPVTVTLKGEKRQVRRNDRGLPEVTWIALDKTTNSRLQPGDVVRYTLIGRNHTNKPISNFTLNNQVPRSTVMVLNSARIDQGQGTITYSINRGASYSPSPVVQEKKANGTVNRPAYAEEYTNVRWTFSGPLPPQGIFQASYQVRVR
jgi:uncharacterized repeat protein (TIGR01451 family)